MPRTVVPHLIAWLAHDDIDWQRVTALAHTPRGVPAPVNGEPRDMEAVLTQALLVDDVLPTGSNWDGKTELLVDEKTFRDLVGDRNKPPPAQAQFVPVVKQKEWVRTPIDAFILSKLEANDRTHAVTIAMKRGFIHG